MNLNDWEKKQVMSCKIARRWHTAGKLLAPAEQAPSGTIIVKLSKRREWGPR